jgi:uncharacterized phage infection (PIP) family protein YhgE
MAFRDRFFTPRTARAILSWRILIGIGVGAAMAIAGLALGVAIGIGVAVYAATVFQAMPKGVARPSIDPFALSEPWRRLMQQAQASGRKLRETVDRVSDGPLKQQLQGIADQLDRGLDEAWAVARRGDEIDDMVRTLDPTALRSKLASLETRAATTPSTDTTAAVDSVRRQLETADRLKRQSSDTAASLQRTQTQLDGLVARASEVRAGLADTDTYARDVDELVTKLEALHQAVEETRTA